MTYLFTLTNLSRANLSGASLNRGNLSEANLLEADLSRANLSGAENLTPSQVRSALNWELAIYDEGLREQLGLDAALSNNEQNNGQDEA